MSERNKNELDEKALEGQVENQPEDERPVPKTGLALRVEQMDEKKWAVWTSVVGVALALIAAACLFFYPQPEGASGISWGPMIALALALVLPGYAERRLERRAPKMRIWLMITLAAALVVYVIVNLLAGNTFLKQ